MISVVACTNRAEFIPNIMANFQKQTLKEKELILILNSSKLNVEIENVLQFPEEMSLGECLNRGVASAKYDVVAKMDDDDYYGPDYLTEAYVALLQTNADIVGKSSFYIYFKKSQEVHLYNPKRENCWILNHGHYKSSYFMSGATMAFKKDIFKKINFSHVNQGEDSVFQRSCFENGLKMYAISKEHYAYVRYAAQQHHHSDVSDGLLRRRSRFVANAPSIEDYFQMKRQ